MDPEPWHPHHQKSMERRVMFWKKKPEKAGIHIFFDVDGVLNKESDWPNKFYVDPACCRSFGKLYTRLADRYGHARCVIISTWRAGLSRDGSSASAAQLKGLYDSLGREGISVDAATPISDKGRQAEVEHYIRRNGVGPYIIIDDDMSLFHDPGSLCLYCPDYRKGFQEDDIKKAEKIAKRAWG